MAVTSSAPISITDLVTEFGGSTPHALTEYYRGGSLVPDNASNSSIPTSGAISLTNFYGAANDWSTTLTIGSNTGLINEYGYGSLGATQDAAPTYGSLSDTTIDILGGAFFRGCKHSSISSGTLYVEIDGGSDSWTTIVINGTSIARTAFTKVTPDQWTKANTNVIGTSGDITVTFVP